MVGITINDGTSDRTVKRIDIADDDNVLRTAQTIDIADDANALQRVFVYLQADYTIAPQTTMEIGHTGNYLNKVKLTAVVTGGTSPFSYAWSDDDTSGVMFLSAPTGPEIFAQSTSFGDSPGSGAVTANVTLVVTDDNGSTATVVKSISIVGL